MISGKRGLTELATQKYRAYLNEGGSAVGRIRGVEDEGERERSRMSKKDKLRDIVDSMNIRSERRNEERQ